MKPESTWTRIAGRLDTSIALLSVERSEKEREKLNIEKKEDIPELDCVALVRYRNTFIGLLDTANKSMIAALEGGEGGRSRN